MQLQKAYPNRVPTRDQQPGASRVLFSVRFLLEFAFGFGDLSPQPISDNKPGNVPERPKGLPC